MHEILDHLSPGSRVLDLGSRGGSFKAEDYPNLLLFAADLGSPGSVQPELRFLRADAGSLPFRSRSFDAVILNHSLEHFERLTPALQEIGRVVKADGAVYVAVPDATTFSDRLYRKVFRDRGGHVNLFGSSTHLSETLSWYFGLPLAGSRTLHASLTFLNRRVVGPGPRRIPWTRLPEPAVALFTAFLRMADNVFGTRLSVYGWALYFGCLKEAVDAEVRTNICVRCGQAHPADWLDHIGAVQRHRWLPAYYRCPGCSAKNFYAAEKGRRPGCDCTGRPVRLLRERPQATVRLSSSEDYGSPAQ